MQCNIGRGPAWEEVFKQPSLKKSCKDLLLRHAVEKEDKKHQTGTSGLSAPVTAHKDLHHHIIYSFFTKPGKVGLLGCRRSSRRCQWSKEPLHSSSPLEEFSPEIKLFFFCRKNRPFLNLDGELGEGWRNVAGPEPSRVPAQSTHQILMWDLAGRKVWLPVKPGFVDQIWGWDAVKIRDNYIW